MSIKKILPRLFIFFIGLPLVLLIVFLDFYNHLPLHLLILFISACASSEMYNMMAVKSPLLNKKFIILCSLFIPFVTALQSILPSFFDFSLTFLNHEVSTYALIASFLAVLSVEVFTAKDFNFSNNRMGMSFFVIVYSGYLITFISRMIAYTKDGQNISTEVISTFLLMVFLCDSFAWLFGVLFGKNNKGFIKASPNKSIAGFIGGFIGSIVAAVVANFLWTNVFEGHIIKIIIVGIITAFSSIVGDLAESIFKRCSGCKDSGKVIPGRGGALDSIDSILMAAPIYSLLINALYGPFI